MHPRNHTEVIGLVAVSRVTISTATRDIGLSCLGQIRLWILLHFANATFATNVESFIANH